MKTTYLGYHNFFIVFILYIFEIINQKLFSKGLFCPLGFVHSISYQYPLINYLDKANIDAITRSNIVHAMTKFPMDQHEIHMLPNQEELLKKDGVEEKDEQEELPSANIPGYYWISLLNKVNV
jgi:hypothetical protein